MSKATLQSVAPVFLVRNITDSIQYWVEKVGFDAKTFEENPRFAIVSRDTVRIMLVEIGLGAKIVPNWTVVESTNDAYIWVDDARDMYHEILERGAYIDYTIYDTPWGTREFGIQDPDNHDITFGQILEK